jgi:hypothetical protein
VRFKVLLFLVFISRVSAYAQKIDRNNLYGKWKIKGVVLRNQIIGFWQPDTLAKRLMEKRKIEQPGKIIPKGDSIAMEMGAHFLCEVLNNLEIQVNNTNDMIFQFAEGKEGSQDNRTHVLQFTFKNDTALATVDEKGYQSDLKIEKLTPTVLIISGISSARYMKLYFKRD